MISIFVYIIFFVGLVALITSVFTKKTGLLLTGSLCFLISGILGFQIEREYCEYVTGWTCSTSTTVDMAFIYVCGVLLLYGISLLVIKYVEFQQEIN